MKVNYFRFLLVRTVLVTDPLPSQQIYFGYVNRQVVSVNGDDDGQSDGGFRRGHAKGKEDQYLSMHITELGAEGDQGEVYGIEHEFGAHEDHDGVLSCQYTDDPNGEQDCRQSEVPIHFHHLFTFSSDVTLSEQESANHGRRQQNGCDENRQHIDDEQRIPDGFDRSDGFHVRVDMRERAGDTGNGVEQLGKHNDPQEEAHGIPEAEPAEHLLFFGKIQQHDHEQEEHHDGPAVYQNLDYGKELGFEEQEYPGYRDEIQDQEKSAVNRIPAGDHADSGSYGQSCKEDKDVSLHVVGTV
jgi:hypothetical protein